MKKLITLLLAMAMVVSVVACGNSEKALSSKESPEQSSEESPEQSSEESVETEITFSNEWAEEWGIPDAVFDYPLEGDRKVTWFFPMDAFISVGCKDLNDHEVILEIEERTGVDIEFIHPAVGETETEFNLMVSSNEYTDIITWSNMYRGGVTAGIEDGVYYDHEEIIDKYSPNYKWFREQNELRRKTTMNDEGQILGYYNLSPYSEWMWLGLLIKKEALDKTGLPVPETIDEWETFLEACRDAGYKGPFTTGNRSMLEWKGAFNGAYDAWEWLFINDEGKADFGPIQPGTKEWLTVYRRWMEKGLVDKEFVSRDWDNMMAFAQSDDCAVIVDSPDTMWGIWKEDMGIDFVGANNAVLNKGDKPKTVYLHPQNGGWETSITTQCEDVEAAARLLDFGYTWEGYELYNFGLPDRTHKIGEDGKPYYHQESAMWNKDDGIPLSNRVWTYKIHQGPFIREEHNSNPLLVAEGSYSGDIRKQWTEATDTSRNFPNVTLLPEEVTREAEMATLFSTRRDEVFTKIVYGELPIDAFDDFVQEVKENGYDEWIGYWQAALDRYNER